jgi:hypothetical protein
MSDHEVLLPGLDGTNPLGFLAALGVLRVLDHHGYQQRAKRPRLRWTERGTWLPVIDSAWEMDAILDLIVSDVATWSDDRAFLLAYEDDSLCDPRKNPKAARDLKPPPSLMATFLGSIAAYAAESHGINWPVRRRTMDMASAFGSELITDNNGRTKPFALHFTAGQQQFLRAIAEIQENVTREDFQEALEGPWRGTSKLPSMSWDSTVARIYSLRASDPSKEKRGSMPGADWLAFVSMGLMLAAPVGRKLETTAVHGRWKTSRFVWPMWNVPLSLPVVRSLLGLRDLGRLSAEQRVLRGIATVMSAGITRADQGGYGAFAPAEPT